MAGYLIYIDGGDSPATIETFLDVASERWANTPVSGKGPSGNSGGQLWHINATEPQHWPHLEYAPDNQVWRSGPGGKYWIGWSKTASVSPEDLRRTDIVNGPLCRLNDDHFWMIVSGFDLPCDFGLGDDGAVSEQTKPEFVPLYEATVKAFDLAKEALKIEDAIPIDETNRTEVAQFVCRMLSVNYYLSFEIAMLLGLFDLPSLWRGLVLATDAKMINDLIDEEQKKRVAEIESATGDLPDTASGEVE